MQEISQENLSPAFRALFDRDFPAKLRCTGVMNAVASAIFLADSPENPSWAVVYELGGGTLYWGGAINQAIIAEVLNYFRARGDVLFGFFDDDPIKDLLPENPDYIGKTLESDKRSSAVDLAALVANLPQNTQILPMTLDLLPRCEWYESVLQTSGSLENFLAYGRGFCLMAGDDLLAEAYSTAYQPDLVELGVLTNAAHRGKGYAKGLCAYLMQTYEQEGIQTYWNCAKQNIASIRLALALGYPMEREYNLWAWFQTK